MPSGVKERATESAQRAGVSLNSWTVDILERALENLRQRQSGTEQPEDRANEDDDKASESGLPDQNGEGNSTDEPGNT
jgi:hypothetical protein